MSVRTVLLRFRTGDRRQDLVRYVRGKQRGGNSGEGKTYHKAPPPKRFWTPRTYDTFPPPLFTPCHFLRGNGHRPDKSHFLRPPKLVLEGALYGTFPPPPPKKKTQSVSPPLCVNTITHKRIAEPNFIILNYVRQSPFCNYRTELFLELISLGNHWEQWITESLGLLTEMFGNCVR